MKENKKTNIYEVSVIYSLQKGIKFSTFKQNADLNRPAGAWSRYEGLYPYKG